MITHQELVEQSNKEKIAIGIDTTLSRKFYTKLSLSEIEEQTGESPKLEKYIIQIANMGNPILLLFSIIFAIFAFKWWALLTIPAFIVVFLFFRSAATMGANMSVINIIICGTIVSSFFVDQITSMQWATIFILLSSIWSANFLYAGSAKFLRAFVLRNKRCYEWLKGDLIIKNKQAT